MLVVKLFSILLVLIVGNVSVNFVNGDETTKNSSNLTELTQTKVTPGIYGGLYDRFIEMFGGSSSTIRADCNCKCGQANLRDYQMRIVGGEKATPHEYPWMAQLYYFRRFRCGGTLINDRFVLTAAHCTNVYIKTMLYVTLGSHDKCTRNSNEWSSYASRVYSPMMSNFPTFGQDISLIRLQYSAPINEYISPICLPEIKEPNHSTYVNKIGTVAGWGARAEQGSSSCILRHVDMPIISNIDCFENSHYKNLSNFLVTEYMMCAGYPKGGYDSCQGDSGGPLIVKRPDKRHEIVGVVSWGVGCARENYPGVYTRITKHLNWIKRIAYDGCSCQN